MAGTTIGIRNDNLSSLATDPIIQLRDRVTKGSGVCENPHPTLRVLALVHVQLHRQGIDLIVERRFDVVHLTIVQPMPSPPSDQGFFLV